MEELLKIPPLNLAIVIGGFSLFALLLLSALLWAVWYLKIRLKVSKAGGVELTPAEPEALAPDYSGEERRRWAGHLSCPHVGDLFLAEELLTQYTNEKFKLLDRFDTFSEQWVYAQLILDTLISTWRADLAETGFPYKRLFLENIRNTVLNKFTEAVRVNGFAKMEEKEATDRARLRADEVCNLLFSEVPQDALEEEERATLRYAYIDMLQNARRIEIDRKKKLEELTNRYKTQRAALLGGNYASV